MNKKSAIFVFCRHSALLMILVMATAAIPSQAADDPGLVTGRPDMQTAAPTGRIVVRLAADSGLSMTRAGLTAVTAVKSAEAERLTRSVQNLIPDGRLVMRIPAADQPGLKALAGPGAAIDLTRYAHIDAGTTDVAVLKKMVAGLNADPAIDLAWIEPVAVPAALGFDAFTGATPTTAAGPNLPRADLGVPSPDFETLQGYLANAPDGVGAWAMRTQSGARGAGVTVIDIEGAWLYAHEDLPAAVADLGVHIDDLSWRNHGTAVLGEIRGHDDGSGVTGIVPDSAVGSSSVNGLSVAEAIVAALTVLQPGDLILIELHGPGPNADGNGQYGYVPMEYWQDNFDAIRLASAQGILVCEAAGNGYQNLDDPIYLDLFDRSVRDSGAIMCGATAGGTLDPADFSNHGTRVDLNGWGWDVVTCAYGDLQGDPDFPETEWYTQAFSGTSSASPIVTGSVASLQGMVRSRYGLDLDARLARDILRQTGTVLNPGHLIGTRPDLVAAFAHADTTIGELTGTVTDLGSDLPLAGVLVQITGQGGFTMTAADGTYRLPLLAGPYDLEFTSYYYATGTGSISISRDQTVVLNMALEILPLIDLTGSVLAGGTAQPGVVVTPTDQPVPPVATDETGVYLISGVPAGYDYQLRFDGIPGFGARVETVVTAGATAPVVTSPVLAPISEDFDPEDGGFVASNAIWTHGVPPPKVTGGAFSGTRGWGVGMSDGYFDNETGYVESVVYDLTGVPAGPYYLSFHFFSATEGGFDGVHLQGSAGAEFSVLEPVGGYTDAILGGLNHAPGWSGNSGRWRGTVFDLSSYVGGTFQFILNFGADSGVTGDGFYVDGITFADGMSVSPVPDQNLPGSVLASLRAWPNPFNPQVNLAYEATRTGRLQVRIYDLRGGLVQTLLDAPVGDTQGTLTWNGRDRFGQNVASGVYLVRLVDAAGVTARQRVVLAR